MKLFWLFTSLLAWALVLLCVEYLGFEPNVNFLFVKGTLQFDSVWQPVFYVHVISGMLCLLVAPLQFIPFIQKNKIAHRWLGYIYVITVIGFSAPTGLYMAFFAEGGFYATVGFLAMGFAWVFFTFLAVRYAIQKDIKKHKQWMFRSYAISLSAVTLRLLVPALSFWSTMDAEFIIIFTAYASWLLNLAISEIILFKYSFSTPKPIVL
jgi:hypothetical protein